MHGFDLMPRFRFSIDFCLSIFMAASFLCTVLFWAQKPGYFCLLIIPYILYDCFLRIEVGFDFKFHDSVRACHWMSGA